MTTKNNIMITYIGIRRKITWVVVMWDVAYVFIYHCSSGGATNRMCITASIFVDVYDDCAKAVYASCGLCPRMIGWRFGAINCCQLLVVG